MNTREPEHAAIIGNLEHGAQDAGVEAPRSRLRQAFPYVLNGSLVLVVAGFWARLVAHVVDYWDGLSLDRREDFVAFYAAASQVRSGLASTIYQPDAIAQVESVLLGRTAGRNEGLAFMNPPFVAGFLQPLTLLPYGAAQAVWFAISALVVLCSVALLWPELRRLRRRWAFAFVLAVLASYPVYMSLLYGQLSPLILLSLALAYRLASQGHAGLAGVALSLSLVKPQLAVVPLLYLLVTGRWRALGGFAIAATAFAALSAALAGPRLAFVGYPSFLIESLGWRTEFGVNRADMFGWNAFFLRWLPAEDQTLAGLLALLLCVATLLASIVVWRRRREPDEIWAPVLAIGATTILVSPHVHTHDLLILAIPAALVAAHRRDAVSIAAAALLLYAAPMAMIGVNLATPLLAIPLVIVLADALGAGEVLRSRAGRVALLSPARS